MQYTNFSSPAKSKETMNGRSSGPSSNERSLEIGSVQVPPPVDFLEFMQQVDPKGKLLATPKHHSPDPSSIQNTNYQPPTCYTIMESQNENGSSMDLSPLPNSKRVSTNLRSSFKLHQGEQTLRRTGR